MFCLQDYVVYVSMLIANKCMLSCQASCKHKATKAQLIDSSLY